MMSPPGWGCVWKMVLDGKKRQKERKGKRGEEVRYGGDGCGKEREGRGAINDKMGRAVKNLFLKKLGVGHAEGLGTGVGYLEVLRLMSSIVAGGAPSSPNTSW